MFPVSRKVSVFVSFLILILCIYFIGSSILRNKIALELMTDRASEQLGTIKEDLPKRLSDIFFNLNKSISNDHELALAFSQKDRTKVQSLLTPYYRELQFFFNNHAVMMEFVETDGTVFFRAHKPDLFGDNHLNEHPMLMDVLKSGEEKYGYEKDPLIGIPLIVATPVYIDGKLIGVLETGVSIDFIIKRLANLSSYPAGILTESGGMQIDFFNTSHELFQHIYSKMKNNRLPSIITSGENTYFIISNITISEYSGSKAGTLVFALDITDEASWAKNNLIKSSILTILFIVIILLIIRRGFLEMVGGLEKKYAGTIIELEKAYTELEETNRNLSAKVEEETEKRRRTEQHFEIQKKFADMGQMINAIAHQWRQPLNALGIYIQDTAERIKENKLTDDELSEFEKVTMDLIMSMSVTIDNFRSFFMPDKSMELINISSETSALLRLMGPQIFSKNISIHTSCTYGGKVHSADFNSEMPVCPEANIYARGYLDEFRQSLINIINNAVYSCEDKMKTETDYHGIINIELLCENRLIILKVSDNGTGVPEQVLPKVFDPYFTTKPQGSGVGIGLYVTKLLIETYMNGTIRMYNNPSGGAAIEINLTQDTTDG